MLCVVNGCENRVVGSVNEADSPGDLACQPSQESPPVFNTSCLKHETNYVLRHAFVESSDHESALTMDTASHSFSSWRPYHTRCSSKPTIEATEEGLRIRWGWSGEAMQPSTCKIVLQVSPGFSGLGLGQAGRCDDTGVCQCGCVPLPTSTLASSKQEGDVKGEGGGGGEGGGDPSSRHCHCQRRSRSSSFSRSRSTSGSDLRGNSQRAANHDHDRDCDGGWSVIRTHTVSFKDGSTSFNFVETIDGGRTLLPHHLYRFRVQLLHGLHEQVSLPSGGSESRLVPPSHFVLSGWRSSGVRYISNESHHLSTPYPPRVHGTGRDVELLWHPPTGTDTGTGTGTGTGTDTGTGTGTDMGTRRCTRSSSSSGSSSSSNSSSNSSSTTAATAASAAYLEAWHDHTSEAMLLAMGECTAAAALAAAVAVVVVVITAMGAVGIYSKREPDSQLFQHWKMEKMLSTSTLHTHA